MQKHYRRTIRASSPSDYQRKLRKATEDIKREVANDIRRQIQKAIRKH